MRSIGFLVGTAALAATVHTASAQAPRLVLEARGGYAIATGEWEEDHVFANGMGFGASVTAMVMPPVGVYAGWESYRFKGKDEGSGIEAEARDAGFRAGVSVSAAAPRYRTIRPFLEAGVIYNTLSLEASVDGIGTAIESEPSLGVEAGVGFSAALADGISIAPVIRYRRHEVEFESFPVFDTTVQYVVLGIGLRLHP